MHVAYGRARRLPHKSFLGRRQKATLQKPPHVTFGVPPGVRTWPVTLFTDAELRQLRTAVLAESSRRSTSLEDLVDVSSTYRSSSHFVASTIPRTGGRFEVKLTPRWKAACAGCLPSISAKLDALTAPLLAEGPCANAHVEWHVMRVAPGASAQEWHVDQNAKKCYHTLIVPLTPDPPDSGTTFKTGRGTPDVTLNPYGGAGCFKGNVVHCGSAHPADARPRLFLYAAITTGENWN